MSYFNNTKLKRFYYELRTLLAYAWPFIASDKGLLFLITIAKLFSFFAGLAIIYLTKITLDNGLFAGNFYIFVFATIGGCALFIIEMLVGYGAQALTITIKSRFTSRINDDFTSALFNREYQYLRRVGSAEHSYLLQYDVDMLASIIFDEISNPF